MLEDVEVADPVVVAELVAIEVGIGVGRTRFSDSSLFRTFQSMFL